MFCLRCENKSVRKFKTFQNEVLQWSFKYFYLKQICFHIEIIISKQYIKPEFDYKF